MIREINQRCHQGKRPAHTTVAKSQASASPDPCDKPPNKAQAYDDLSLSFKKTRAQAEHMPQWSSHPSLRSGSAKISDKKYWKENKKSRCQEQARKNLTPATSVSAASLADKAPNGTAHNGGAHKDLSHITCIARRRVITQVGVPSQRIDTPNNPGAKGQGQYNSRYTTHECRSLMMGQKT